MNALYWQRISRDESSSPKTAFAWIKGLDLKMNKLNLDNSELSIEGKIIALVYSENEVGKKGGGMLGKIFK